MAMHVSIPAWQIPWTEEPGRLQSLGLKKELDITSWLNNSNYNLDSQFSSGQLLSHVWLSHPKDWSMPDFPVYHQLPKLALTPVYQVSDAIQTI